MDGGDGVLADVAPRVPGALLGVVAHGVDVVDAIVGVVPVDQGVVKADPQPLAAKGLDMGKSLVETDQLETALDIEAAAEAAGCKLVLPIDLVVAKEFKAHAPHEVKPVAELAADDMALDVGSMSVDLAAEAINDSKTLIWNGPLGAFEIPPFDTSTVELAKFAAGQTRTSGLVSVAGGGDTVAALNHAGVADDFTFVSTAGGAFLEWMEGRALPGVEALKA